MRKLLALLALPLLLHAGDETRFSLSLTDEGSVADQLRVPESSLSGLLLLQTWFSWKHAERWRFVTSLATLAREQDSSHAQLKVKETYLGYSAGDLDFTVGKKILKWGTGYAFTPSGVLDPPRDPTDPTDRLNLNEGREMVAVDLTEGRHSLTAVWADAGLVGDHRPGMRETAALRYNVMVDGFDTSWIVARDRGRDTFTGANFTRVFGEALEVHGEFAHRESTAALLGGKYTTRSGVGAIFEYYSAPLAGALRRQSYAFFRVAKSRLRELPGWKEWDVDASVVANLTDGSRVAVFDASRRIRGHFSVYGRAEFPAGKKTGSQYGTIPYSAMISLGFQVQL